MNRNYTGNIPQITKNLSMRKKKQTKTTIIYRCWKIVYTLYISLYITLKFLAVVKWGLLVGKFQFWQNLTPISIHYDPLPQLLIFDERNTPHFFADLPILRK